MTINNTTLPNNLYPVANGLASSSPFVQVFAARDPTTADTPYPIQKQWLNTTTNGLWELKNFTTSNGNLSAVWIKIGGGLAVLQVTLQAGTSPIVPNAGNINFNGTAVANAGVPVQTDGTGPSTMALQVQYAGSDTADVATKVGIASFNSNQFTVSATGFVQLVGSTPLKWNVINQGTEPANFLVNNGYICQAGGTGNVSIALPAVSVLGDSIAIVLDGATTWTITQAIGQQIRISGSQTTLGATGTVATTGTGDTLILVCETANTKWLAAWGYNGNLTVT